MVVIDGESFTLEMAAAVAAGATLVFGPNVESRVKKNRAVVEKLIRSDKAIYGLNTGFGYFANTKIPKNRLKKLQHNIVRSHAAGYGDPLPPRTARLCAALRLNVLARGLTGVRFALLEQLRSLLNAGVSPMIPKQGSVGASGDLIPLAHTALALIGEGEVWVKGRRCSAREGLGEAGLSPLQLAEKEGLSLINGTQAILSIGSLAILRSQHLIHRVNQVTALSYEALTAHISPLDSRLHLARGQLGQITCAEQIREQLEGSYLLREDLQHARVQDPYSLRCAPQVHGASLDSLNFASAIVSRELNAVTDNPLVFTKEGEAVSGGNFHAQPLAMALDVAAMAMAELGNISDRRLEVLLNPQQSKLSAFLACEDGLHSGLMALQYLSASLVNKNKLLANPACTDSIPGNVGIEDHVSMGMTAAEKLKNEKK